LVSQQNILESTRGWESGRDWLFVVYINKRSTWGIMLKTRDRLKECSPAPQKWFQSLFAKVFPDDTFLRYKELKAQHPPNSSDLNFLRRWFKDRNLGDFPLTGRDSTLWETSDPSNLIAIRAGRAEGPLDMLFLSKIVLWWHNCIGSSSHIAQHAAQPPQRTLDSRASGTKSESVLFVFLLSHFSFTYDWALKTFKCVKCLMSNHVLECILAPQLRPRHEITSKNNHSTTHGYLLSWLHSIWNHSLPVAEKSLRLNYFSCIIFEVLLVCGSWNRSVVNMSYR